MNQVSDSFHGSFRGYALGYGLCLLITLGAFWAAFHLPEYAVPAVVLAAVLQLLVQLVFFLHMRSSLQVWRVTGAFTLVVIGIVLGGTLWIMHNLSHLHPQHDGSNLTDLYMNGAVAPQNELK